MAPVQKYAAALNIFYLKSTCPSNYFACVEAVCLLDPMLIVLQFKRKTLLFERSHQYAVVTTTTPSMSLFFVLLCFSSLLQLVLEQRSPYNTRE